MALDPESFIDDAIKQGSRLGLRSLAGVARQVYLISEAEVLCDMEGIDSFVDAYGGAGVAELAEAYAFIGAWKISSVLREISGAMPGAREEALDLANALICDRAGYGYEDIANAVVRSEAG
jgi:hypothetical protein